jgi:hypothetical protein
MNILKLHVFKSELWEVTTAPVGEIPEKDFVIRTTQDKNQDKLLDYDNNPVHYDAVLLIKGFKSTHPRALVEFIGIEKVKEATHIFSNGAEVDYTNGPYWKINLGKVLETANFHPRTRYWKGREVIHTKFPKEEYGVCKVKRANDTFIAVEFEKPLPVIYNEGMRDTIAYYDQIKPAM